MIRPPALPGVLLLTGLLLVHPLVNAAGADNGELLTARSQPPLKAIATLEAAEKARARLTAKDAELVSQLSFAYSLAVDEYAWRKEKKQAESAARQALAAAERAVALNERHANAHLALAVAYGKLADYVSNREKLEFSRIIRREAERTLELNPSEDIAHHILGRWHYGFATLNPVMRMTARAVFGKLPEASLDESISHLEKAAALNPDYSPHRHRLATALESAGKKKEARPHWQKVLSLPAKDHDDRRAQRAATRALAK